MTLVVGVLVYYTTIIKRLKGYLSEIRGREDYFHSLNEVFEQQC